jgi:hypothetical protein
MTKFLIIYGIVLIIGMIGGWYFGICSMVKRASDGVCIRADDGEAYLRISEAGQKKLLEPDTKLLYIRVIDISTRNNHGL